MARLRETTQKLGCVGCTALAHTPFPKSGENWISVLGVLQCSIPRRNPVVSTVTQILGITPCRLPWPFTLAAFDLSAH